MQNSDPDFRILPLVDPFLLRECLVEKLKKKLNCNIVESLHIQQGAQLIKKKGKLESLIVLVTYPIMSREFENILLRLQNESMFNYQVILILSKISQTKISQAMTMNPVALTTADDPFNELIHAIRRTQSMAVYYSRNIRSFTFIGKENKNSSSDKHLSSREQEVLTLYARGRSTKEIARRLSISPKTVERHKANFKSKLKLSSLYDLIAYAIKEKLIILD